VSRSSAVSMSALPRIHICSCMHVCMHCSAAQACERGHIYACHHKAEMLYSLAVHPVPESNIKRPVRACVHACWRIAIAIIASRLFPFQSHLF
jgi:hypothetical protein